MRPQDAEIVNAKLAELVDTLNANGQALRIGIGIIHFSQHDARIALRPSTREDLDRFYMLADSDLPHKSELDIVIGAGSAVPESPRPPLQTPRATARCRPVYPGVSIGRVGVTHGTLGALVEIERGSRKLFMLSANQVLANSNSESNPNAAAAGDEIIQPSSVDSSVGDSSVVGRLSRWELLSARGNRCDAALASCDPSIGWEPAIPGVGLISGTADPQHGMEVQMVSRASGLRRGRITAYPVRSLPVQYGPNIFRFDEVVEVTGQGMPFGGPGDSGAVVLDLHGLAIGLVFAHTSNVTYVNPIVHVQRALGFACFWGS